MSMTTVAANETKKEEVKPAAPPAKAPMVRAPVTAATLGITSQGDDSFRLSLEPVTMNDVCKVADIAFQLQLCGVTSPEDALVRIMAGREQGLSTFMSLQKCYVVEGRPSFSAEFIEARAKRHPSCEYIRCTLTTAEKCVYVAKRFGEPEIELTWTIEDARRALLLDRGDNPQKNNWNKYPAPMLRARCRSAIAHLVFPDADLPPAREDIEDGARGSDSDVGGATASTAPKDVPSGEILDGEIVPQAEQRDFAKEADAISARIVAATTDAEKKQLRDEIVNFDGGSELVKRLKDEHKAKFARLVQADATPAATVVK